MKNRENFTCLAIDMGASNVRIMLGKISAGNLEIIEIHRFSNTMIEIEGKECWDVDHLTDEIIVGINKASSEKEIIDSLGVDSWGVDFVLLDKEGNLSDLPVSYRDKRTEGMEEAWSQIMTREETFRRTGINFYIFNSLFQILSMRDDLASLQEGRLLFIPSYILSRLGGKGINEITISSTSQLLNADTCQWDEKILLSLGIPGTTLGRTCEPGTMLGKISHPDINTKNINAIAVCEHDTASAVVSVPFRNQSSVFISTGTWCIVGLESAQPILSVQALNEGFTNERGYGGSFRFLKNIVGLWLVQGLMKSFGLKEEYNAVESLARRYMHPANVIDPGDAVFYNPADMKETFDQYFRNTNQELPAEPGGYFHCAYNSLVYSFLRHIELIEEMTGKNILTIHLIGGGCRSDYLTNQTALICRRQVIVGPVEAAATGNVLVQAISNGILRDVSEARTLVSNVISVSHAGPSNQDDAHVSGYGKFLELSGK